MKVPKFVFYYREENIGYVEGPDVNTFTMALNKIVEQLQAVTTSLQQNETEITHPSDDDQQTPSPSLSTSTSASLPLHSSPNDENHNMEQVHDNNVKNNSGQVEPKKGTSLADLKNKEGTDSKPTPQSPTQQSYSPTQQSPSQNNQAASPKQSEDMHLSQEDLESLLQLQNLLTKNNKKVNPQQLLQLHQAMKLQQTSTNTNTNTNTNTTSASSPKHNQQASPTNQDFDKQRKLDELRKLNNMRYSMQMKKAMQLRELKMLKKMKESEEE